MSEVKRTVYICQGCEKPLLKDTDGFVVKGNICVADGHGGLIGNAFTKVAEDGTVHMDTIREYPFCTECFHKATFGHIQEQGVWLVDGKNVDDIHKIGE